MVDLAVELDVAVIGLQTDSVAEVIHITRGASQWAADHYTSP